MAGPTEEVAAPPARVGGGREPSLLDALIPVFTLIPLIALTIVIFGGDATNGPLQVALLTSAAVAAAMARKNGHSIDRIRDAAVTGVSSAMSAIFILLAIGALMGTWNMSGVIPAIVYYGLGILSATWFYLAAAFICGVVGMVTGSSWTTAGTLGVAFVAIAPLLGADQAMAAGAVISGAYFGDKMTPISETTVLVPSLVGGVTTAEHIGAMVWTSGVAFVFALVAFAVLGFVVPASSTGFDTSAAQATLANEFWISPIDLLPLLLLMVLSIRRAPPFLAIYISALFAAILGVFTQWPAVSAFVNKPDENVVIVAIEGIYRSMATGFVSASGNESIDMLFSRGGMASMLTTIWLVLGALSFAAIMEDAGFLERLIRPVVTRTRSTGSLIAAVLLTAFGLNVVAGDQYVADVLPSRIYRTEFARRGLAPRMLSRAVEDSGTVTSPLIPWNTCGAYMAGVLGVATAAYLPFCLYNIASPLISAFYGFTGIRIEHVKPPAEMPHAPEQRRVEQPAETPIAAQGGHI